MSSSGPISPVSATFSRNLKTARKARGWTQHQLAVQLGRGDGMTISRWERGENRPNDESLVVLAQLLDREVSWFFTDHHKPKEAAA